LRLPPICGGSSHLRATVIARVEMAHQLYGLVAQVELFSNPECRAFSDFF
jgi:hypothetical protein